MAACLTSEMAERLMTFIPSVRVSLGMATGTRCCAIGDVRRMTASVIPLVSSSAETPLAMRREAKDQGVGDWSMPQSG